MIKSKRKHFTLLELEKSKTSRIRKNKRMFTLIELIIVIVVIGILAGMALPKFTGVVRNSKVAAMVTDIDTLEKAIMMYEQDNDTLPLLEETKTFGLQRLTENDMEDIYPSLQEALKLSEDSEEYLYKINLDESSKYHSKTKYGHGKTDKDFYVYSTKSNEVYYYGYLKDGDDKYNHNEYPIMLTSNELVKKTPSKPLDSKPEIPNIKDKAFIEYGNSSFSKIELTKDNGYIVVGSTLGNTEFGSSKGESDAIIVKYNNNAEIEWFKVLGGSSSDIFKSVKQTSDGGYIVSGYTTSNNGDFGTIEGVHDGLIVKFNSIGDVEWFKTLGGSGGDRFDTELINEIIETKNGDFVAVGTTFGGGDFDSTKGRNDGVILKLNKNGEIKWHKVLGGELRDYFYSIAETSNGELVVAGSIESNTGDFPNKDGKSMLLVSFNSNGEIQWFNHYKNSSLKSIRETKDGGIVGVGEKQNDSEFGKTNGYSDGFIIKFNSKGDIEWHNSIGGTWVDSFDSVSTTSDGGYIISGNNSSGENIAEDIISKGHLDGLIAKFNSNGEIEWHKSLGGTNQDQFFDIKETIDKGFITIGKISSKDGDFENSTLDNKSVIIKFDKNGDFK